MGRTTPSKGAPPASSRRDARAKRAKQTLNKDIPALLQANLRARKGVESSELIVDPLPVPSHSFTATTVPDITGSSAVDGINQAVDGMKSHEYPAEVNVSQRQSHKPPTIRLQVADTFQAAASLISSTSIIIPNATPSHTTIKPKPKNANSPNVAILNMASPLRAGGGFLNGASSQEESLCMRSTLFPALKDEFYRLPEVGGTWTSDILVFRSHHEGVPDLAKTERFFVDVVSAAMLRHPDVAEHESGEKYYANEEDREMVERKMRAVMRIVKSKGAKAIVLGAWGCGAFSNPVREVATLWKKVLLGSTSASTRAQRREKEKDKSADANQVGMKSMSNDTWEGMEIVFAIKEEAMARSFASYFGEGLELEIPSDIVDIEADVTGEGDEPAEETTKKIMELKSQIAATRSDVLRERLQIVLSRLES